ncbi:hypothetical protein AYI68_g7450 [Smittium mucronatum]|uniref:Uncharacterized protein n=1 Tax=Smittium mucronatum TaxID=133383 RepID=A0A1R0GNM6_9FUNG|nr:hypothetical protein AYI68_g7450 [Smittium mucronatum]
MKVNQKFLQLDPHALLPGQPQFCSIVSDLGSLVLQRYIYPINPKKEPLLSQVDHSNNAKLASIRISKQDKNIFGS